MEVNIEQQKLMLINFQKE